MKTFDVLLEQHKKLKTLMNGIEKKGKKTTGNMEPLDKEFQKFKTLFSLHDEVEETILYKWLGEIPQLHELILKAQQAHHAAKMILLELRLLPFTSEEWLPKFLILKSSVLMHMEEEEGTLFKKAEKNLSPVEQEEMKIALATFIKDHS